MDPAAFSAGFRTAMLVSAGLLLFAGALAWFTIDPGAGRPAEEPARHDAHCSVPGPPLRAGRR